MKNPIRDVNNQSISFGKQITMYVILCCKTFSTLLPESAVGGGSNRMSNLKFLIKGIVAPGHV